MSQPANTDIKVYRRVRAQVEPGRHDPVNVQGRCNPKIVIVPADEIRVSQTRDALITDAWRLGHPLVRYKKDYKYPADVFTGVTGLDFPVRLTNTYRDLFIQKDEDNIADDLFGEVKAL